MKVQCPKCRENVLKKSLDGKTRLRSRAVYWESDNRCFAVCERCKTSVQLPLVILGDTPTDGAKKHVVLE